MYTRSYPKRESTAFPSEPTLATTPKVIDGESIPEGYCGTAILRENEKSVQDTPKGETESAYFSAPSPSAPSGRARRLKVATKVTPVLWSADTPSDSTAEEQSVGKAVPCDNRSCRDSGNETSESSAGTADETAEKDTEADCESCEKAPRHGKKSNFGAHGRLKCTAKRRLRDRSFSLEDLFLGGLILLLLNEGADDDIILILGFLLFSAM